MCRLIPIIHCRKKAPEYFIMTSLNGNLTLRDCNGSVVGQGILYNGPSSLHGSELKRVNNLPSNPLSRHTYQKIPFTHPPSVVYYPIDEPTSPNEKNKVAKSRKKCLPPYQPYMPAKLIIAASECCDCTKFVNDEFQKKNITKKKVNIDDLKDSKDMVKIKSTLCELGVDFHSSSDNMLLLSNINKERCQKVFGASPSEICICKPDVNTMRGRCSSLFRHIYCKSGQWITMWSNGKPPDWPDGVFFGDPNNGMKDKEGNVVKRPNKLELFRMYQWLVTKLIVEISDKLGEDNIKPDNLSSPFDDKNRPSAFSENNLFESFNKMEKNLFENINTKQAIIKTDLCKSVFADNVVQANNLLLNSNVLMRSCRDNANGLEQRNRKNSVSEMKEYHTIDIKAFSELVSFPDEIRGKNCFTTCPEVKNFHTEVADEMLLTTDINIASSDAQNSRCGIDFVKIPESNFILSSMNLCDRAQYLDYYLNELGFKIIDVKGDGNCLFRALSILLFNIEDNHFLLRKLVAELIESRGFENSKYYRILFNTKQEFEMYIKSLYTPGNYDHEQEEVMMAIAELCHCEVHVYMFKSEMIEPKVYKPFSNLLQESSQLLRIAYYEYEKHYKAVVIPVKE